jgi:hypothetical protein
VVKRNDENAETMHEHTGEVLVASLMPTSGILDDFFEGCDAIVD